jgi:hypothetical protein
MIKVKKIELGEYTVSIEYHEDGSGFLKISVFDALDGEIDTMIISNDLDANDINPSLN